MHYDVIYCPFPINSQYLKMWRVDNPVANKLWGEGKKFWKKLKRQIHVLKMNEAIRKFTSYTEQHLSGLCSSRAWWPLGPNFSPLAARKSQIFYTNHMLGTQEFTVSEHWAPFNFRWSTALICAIYTWEMKRNQNSLELHWTQSVGLWFNWCGNRI